MTVASLLKSQGYNTACIGKWHLGMDMQTRVGGVFRMPMPLSILEPIKPILTGGSYIKGPTSVGFAQFLWNFSVS
ncbi:MAG: hypothetical protein Ct9H90mP25_2230 [Gammaproteobacteria bacterium]|nr:MAG: hypothetical protein Ct9H90mP25_2230 [Gammaproteobacteria bacterium]